MAPPSLSLPPQVHGVWLDLVNLRSESYASDSRIPEMTFGTAKEDAERRDLTINALYYNIMTKEVEDLTGKGLEDLRKGIVRTPLAPRTTFLDDPLRVLRAVRFAHRFDFAIDAELVAAAAEPEVREALRTKARRRSADHRRALLLASSLARCVDVLLSMATNGV